MGKVEISIIVPVYRAEKYLSRCVGSILEQTFTDFELILVDDGSPDKSGKLCDKYAKKDSRIKVIHKENGGVSSARNAGLDIAQGKYITFIDSDDWVSEKYLQLLIEPMIKEDVQLVVGSYETRDKNIFHRKVKTSFIDILKLKDDERAACYDMHHLKGPCMKMFLLSIIKKNNLRFKLNIHFGEDTIFVRNYLRFCEKIYTIEEIIYFYNRFNESSLTRKINERRKEWEFELVNDYYNFLEAVGINEKDRNYAVSLRAFYCFHGYLGEIITIMPKQLVIEEIKNRLILFEKYLFLDLGWTKKEDSYKILRQTVSRKDCSEIYNAYKEKYKRKKLRKLLSKIKWSILRPYLERKRDGLNKYNYLNR